MGTMYRSPEEIAFYAKRKADRAAAPKVEAPVYVAPERDPRVALMPESFANEIEQAAWCLAHSVVVIDHNCYEVRNFGTGFRASVAMEAALRVAPVVAIAPIAPVENLPEAPVSRVLNGTGRAPTVGQVLNFRDGSFVVTQVSKFRIDDATASLRGCEFLGAEGGRGYSATLAMCPAGED